MSTKSGRYRVKQVTSGEHSFISIYQTIYEECTHSPLKNLVIAFHEVLIRDEVMYVGILYKFHLPVGESNNFHLLLMKYAVKLIHLAGIVMSGIYHQKGLLANLLQLTGLRFKLTVVASAISFQIYRLLIDYFTFQFGFPVQYFTCRCYGNYTLLSSCSKPFLRNIKFIQVNKVFEQERLQILELLYRFPPLASRHSF